MDNYQEILEQREQKGIRINKYLADHGLCSRRKADEWIAAGNVRINGEIATAGHRVHEGDEVVVNGQSLCYQEVQLPEAPAGRQKPPRAYPDGRQTVYLALHKPLGIVCTTNPKEKGNLTDYMKFPLRIFPIGRLDKDSTGLLLLTNDGDIVNRILRAKNAHEKEYLVEVDKPLHAEDLDEMSRGVPILDTVTLPCKIKKISPRSFRICLTQGLNRQIRRMAEYVGYEVTSLQRVRIMNITLGQLKPGEWRYLTEAEIAQLEGLLESRELGRRKKG